MPCSIASYGVLVAVSAGYPPVTGKSLTCYAPFRRSPSEHCCSTLPLDLHVLSLPLAFILSQDQTLLCIFLILQVQSGTSNSFKKLTLSFFVFWYLLPCTFFSLFNELSCTRALPDRFSRPRQLNSFASVRCPCFVTGLQR